MKSYSLYLLNVKAKHAENLRVDSLLTLPEMYFRPSNGKELTIYLKLISDAAPKTPLLYYHTPVRAPVKSKLFSILFF